MRVTQQDWLEPAAGHSPAPALRRRGYASPSGRAPHRHAGGDGRSGTTHPRGKRRRRLPRRRKAVQRRRNAGHNNRVQAHEGSLDSKVLPDQARSMSRWRAATPRAYPCACPDWKMKNPPAISKPTSNNAARKRKKKPVRDMGTSIQTIKIDVTAILCRSNVEEKWRRPARIMEIQRPRSLREKQTDGLRPARAEGTIMGDERRATR